jgi:hypothetical protein
MNKEQISKLKKGDLIIDIRTHYIYSFISVLDEIDIGEKGWLKVKAFSKKDSYIYTYLKGNDNIELLDDYYKVGDYVKIRSEYHKGCDEDDYRFYFNDCMLNEYGGKIYKIEREKLRGKFELAGDVMDMNWSPEMFEYKIEPTRSLLKDDYINLTCDISELNLTCDISESAIGLSSNFSDYVDFYKQVKDKPRINSLYRKQSVSGKHICNEEEETEMKIEDIKKEHLVEAKKQFDEERRAREIQFALEEYTQYKDQLDELDREIKMLQEKRQVCLGLLKKFDDKGKKK